jgi:hypothetical protein
MVLSDRECSRQEPKPLELKRGHEEAVRHEPGNPLKVERLRATFYGLQLSQCRGLFFIQFMDFDGDNVVRSPGRSPLCPSLDRCNYLRYGISHTTENLEESFPVSLVLTLGDDGITPHW